jgi:hypothetical protein
MLALRTFRTLKLSVLRMYSSKLQPPYLWLRPSHVLLGLGRSAATQEDQLIRLNPITSGAPCKEDLRLVTVWDERNQCEVRLLTNQLQFAANTIAAIYRERWQIERIRLTNRTYHFAAEFAEVGG